MAGIDAFLSPEFNAVQYVNDICKMKPADVAIERHLTDVELRLQLASEDVAGRLADASGRAVQRVPLVLQDLLRIQEDLTSAQEAMRDMGSALADTSRGAGAQAVDRLSVLEGVKCRMQSAADALEEATGLAALFHRVDSLFEERDLPAIASALAAMRRGLLVIGGRVPGVTDGEARLATLQSRFAGMLQGPLSSALRERRAREVVTLASWLEAGGDCRSLRRQYCNELQASLLKLWGTTSTNPAAEINPSSSTAAFVGFLPQFFDGVAELVETEATWLGATLPGRALALLCAALGSFFEDISGPFKSRLEGAIAAPTGSTLPLDRLVAAQDAASDFLARLGDLVHTKLGESSTSGGVVVAPSSLSKSDSAQTTTTKDQDYDLGRVARSVMAPLEDVLIQKYARLEGEVLQNEARRAVAALGAVGSGLTPDLATALAGSIKGLCVAGHAAFRRSDALTGHTLLPALAAVVDDAARQYLVAARGALAARLSAAQREGAEDEAGAAAALELAAPLSPAAASIRDRLHALDAAFCRAALAMVGGGSGSPDDTSAINEAPTSDPKTGAWRYDAHSARLAREAAVCERLRAFQWQCRKSSADQDKEPSAVSGPPPPPTTKSDWCCLPQAEAGVTALQRVISDSVLSIALARPRAQFRLLAKAPEYIAATRLPAGGADLPVFSAIPLAPVTAAGEHLLLMPQVLEGALLREDSGSEAPLSPHASQDEALASVNEWTVIIANQAAAELLELTLRALPRLSVAGAAQLSADLEYLCNVLGTLGIEVPEELGAWSAAVAAADRAALAGLLRDAGSVAARDAVRTVASLRGWEHTGKT